MFPIKKKKLPKTEVPVSEFSFHEVENVINDVIANVREDFLDEGASKEALQLLKDKWCSKMMTRQDPDMDKNSTAGPSPSGAVPFPVRQEAEKMPVSQPNPDPKEDVIMMEE